MGDEIKKFWEVTASEAFWRNLAWAAVELGCDETRAFSISNSLLIAFLRMLRDGHRIVVRFGDGEEQEITREWMSAMASGEIRP